MKTALSTRIGLPLLSALTLAFSALVAGTTWASPAAVGGSPGEFLEATIVSRHRQPILAQVWVGATMHRLGTMRPGEQRTFELPATVTPGVTYYFVADCPDAHRIMSEPILAAADTQPQFIVSLSQESSYLRFEQKKASDQ